MMLMDYTSTIGGDLPGYANKATWNLLNAYIDSQSQRLLEEYPGNGLQAITILQNQCANMIFLKIVDTIDYFRKWCTQ